ncbi:MAG TPA: aldo/keto reductase [Candidatus Paceibacterota bacterium]|nr:aldo/keto reductase [Verrucomicrobiota bacterium]HRY51229.1 aldo/keto reductase [Candidatus Paceibacterota bacterium]HSA02772.1 aldo/keto reductase [Candidatus Paceibacterota bacterium]
MKRRSFLKTVGGVASVCAIGTPHIHASESALSASIPAPAGEMPRRELGRTGARVSVVGFPGLALSNYDQARGTDGVHEAFDRGINYFDVAPAYGNGQCETRMGIAMQGLDRGKIFLSCKTKKRDKEGARQELENSLKQLKTDHFDLYQMHHLVKPEEVQKALGPGGAIETFLKAKEEGKIKHLGFSAHTTKGALEAMRLYPKFDTVMFPINFVEYYLKDFGKEVMELANQQGAGLISIKPMSRGTWPQGVEHRRQWWYRAVEDDLELRLAWRFVLSQPGVASGIPPSFLDHVGLAIHAVKDFKPITQPEIEELKRVARTTDSIFTREEAMVAMNGAHPGCPYGWA